MTEVRETSGHRPSGQAVHRFEEFGFAPAREAMTSNRSTELIHEASPFWRPPCHSGPNRQAAGHGKTFFDAPVRN